MRDQSVEAGKERVAWLDGEKRTIAFVDILGFSEEVKKLEQHPEGFRKVTTALRGGPEAAVPADGEDDLFSLLAGQEGEDRYGVDLQAAFFSDCAYVSARGVEGGTDKVVSVVLGYARHLLMQEFFLRGGIACGPAAHHERMMVGPAVLTAHSLEEKAAVYPRIVVEDAVAKRLRSLDPEPNPIATIRRGEDGLYFVDVLTTLGLRDDGEEVLQQAGKLIVERLTAGGTLEIKAKWRWLAAQYNRALRSVDRKGKPTPSPIPRRLDVAELPDAL